MTDRWKKSTQSLEWRHRHCRRHRRISHCMSMFITDRISDGGNAIASVRPSVRLFPLYLRDRLTIELERLHVSRSWLQFAGDWRSRSWVRLMRSVRPRSQAFFLVLYSLSLTGVGQRAVDWGGHAHPTVIRRRSWERCRSGKDYRCKRKDDRSCMKHLHFSTLISKWLWLICQNLAKI